MIHHQLRARGRSAALDVDIDDDVDVDPNVELDGSEAIRGRLPPPLTSTLARRRAPSSLAVQDRSTSSVAGGLDVVRRRQPQGSGATIRSTSAITNAISKTCDESSGAPVGSLGSRLATVAVRALR